MDGRVTLEEGTGLGNATVSFRRADGAPGPELTTGPDGRFSVDGIAMGDWLVEVAAPAYEPRSIPIHLPDPSSWLGPLDVRLVPTPPPAVPPSAAPSEALSARDLAVEPFEDVPRADEDDGEWEPSPAPEGYAAVEAALAGGRVDRALTLAAGLGPSDEGSAELFFSIGRGFLKAGETHEAIRFFDRALERDPRHLPALYARALGLLALGRHDAARKDLEAIRDDHPDDPLAARARQVLTELDPALEASP